MTVAGDHCEIVRANEKIAKLSTRVAELEAERDQLKATVRALVEAIVKYVEITAKVLDGKADKPEAMTVASNLKRAIAAAEAYIGVKNGN